MDSEQTEQTWSIDGSDPEMNAAIQAARSSLGTFFTSLANPQPNEKGASFTPDQITDWMYFGDDKLVGGFAARLLIRRKNTIS